MPAFEVVPSPMNSKSDYEVTNMDSLSAVSQALTTNDSSSPKEVSSEGDAKLNPGAKEFLPGSPMRPMAAQMVPPYVIHPSMHPMWYVPPGYPTFPHGAYPQMQPVYAAPGNGGGSPNGKHMAAAASTEGMEAMGHPPFMFAPPMPWAMPYPHMVQMNGVDNMEGAQGQLSPQHQPMMHQAQMAHHYAQIRHPHVRGQQQQQQRPLVIALSQHPAGYADVDGSKHEDQLDNHHQQQRNAQDEEVPEYDDDEEQQMETGMDTLQQWQAQQQQQQRSESNSMHEGSSEEDNEGEEETSDDNNNHDENDQEHQHSDSSNNEDNDLKQGNVSEEFVLDVNTLQAGYDGRTTLMVKNIPNKYTQKNLLEVIDKNHQGTYDFFYLPIDFKNKCNLGYAFINFVDPKHIGSFYNEFANKKWGRFNSDKVCELSFARIQSKQSLIVHFRNSRLMFKHEKYRPIVIQAHVDPKSGVSTITHTPLAPAKNTRYLRGRDNNNNKVHNSNHNNNGISFNN